MGTTRIEWYTSVWNPITGCTKISPGCKNCYAERMAKRLAGRYGYPKDDPFRPTFHEDRIDQPLKWKKRRMVFVCSMGDIFHEDLGQTAVHKVLHAAECAPQHVYLFLTKRPGRMMGIITDHWQHSKVRFPNWWFGVTAENQEQADKRIPILLQIPAAVRFVSVEPMLGPVDINKYLPDKPLCAPYLDWVICGGESGPGARPMHPDWARGLRDQCEAAGVPFFFKQWGEWGTSNYHLVSLDPVFRQFYSFTQWMDKATTWVNGGRCIDIDGSDLKRGIDFKEANYPVAIMHRVGKKKAGRILDGRTWDQYPS